MAKVGKLFKSACGPLDALCGHKPYESWTWRNICQEDPDWILWLLTESRILVMPTLERELLSETRKNFFLQAP